MGRYGQDPPTQLPLRLRHHCVKRLFLDQGSLISKTSQTQRHCLGLVRLCQETRAEEHRQLSVALGSFLWLSFSPEGESSPPLSLRIPKLSLIGSQLLRKKVLLLFRNSDHFRFWKGQDNAQNSIHLSLYVLGRINFSSLYFSIQRLLGEAPGDVGPALEHYGVD